MTQSIKERRHRNYLKHRTKIFNNDGNKHRKIIKGEWICSWLVRNNFPIGFQILCFNCNSSKGFFGYYPHKKGDKLATEL